MIDPGTGSMIFSILIGVVATVFFIVCFVVIIVKLIKNRNDKKR